LALPITSITTIKVFNPKAMLASNLVQLDEIVFVVDEVVFVYEDEGYVQVQIEVW
jgi:hypothetical protein